jgi:hypothetical protein
MCASGNEHLRRCAALAAMAILLPLSAMGQWDERPPGRLAALTSAPVAVPLVATLESLSVSASPAAVPLPVSSAGTGSSLSVTIAWTIRANCTTLRLSGYSGAFAAFQRDPFSVSPSDSSGRLFPVADRGATLNETDWPGIAQPVGPTSYPGSRTDNLGFVIDRSDNSTSAAFGSPVYIFAQAL